MGAVLMSVDISNTIVRAVRAARHSYIIEVLPHSGNGKYGDGGNGRTAVISIAGHVYCTLRQNDDWEMAVRKCKF